MSKLATNSFPAGVVSGVNRQVAVPLLGGSVGKRGDNQPYDASIVNNLLWITLSTFKFIVHTALPTPGNVDITKLSNGILAFQQWFNAHNDAYRLPPRVTEDGRISRMRAESTPTWKANHYYTLFALTISAEFSFRDSWERMHNFHYKIMELTPELYECLGAARPNIR